DSSLTHEQDWAFGMCKAGDDFTGVGTADRWWSDPLARNPGGSGAFERLQQPFDEHRAGLAIERKADRLSQLRLNVLGCVDAKRAFHQRRRDRPLIDGVKMEPVIGSRRSTDEVQESDRVLKRLGHRRQGPSEAGTWNGEKRCEPAGCAIVAVGHE